MNRAGAIIIIEDDLDDQQFLADVFEELDYKNEIVFFSDGIKALAYIVDTSIEPFLILSDINMPKLNGIELRAKIYNNEELRMKCIPYLFFSTNAEQAHVIEAYSQSIQGFFIKPSSYEHLKQTLKLIVDYWLKCVSPNYLASTYN